MAFGADSGSDTGDAAVRCPTGRTTNADADPDSDTGGRRDTSCDADTLMGARPAGTGGKQGCAHHR